MQIFLELFLQWMPCFLQLVVYINNFYLEFPLVSNMSNLWKMSYWSYTCSFSKNGYVLHTWQSPVQWFYCFSVIYFFNNILLDRFCCVITLALQLVWYFQKNWLFRFKNQCIFLYYQHFLQGCHLCSFMKIFCHYFSLLTTLKQQKQVYMSRRNPYKCLTSHH